jgi:hypothetical protein
VAFEQSDHPAVELLEERYLRDSAVWRDSRMKKLHIGDSLADSLVGRFVVEGHFVLLELLRRDLDLLHRRIWQLRSITDLALK